MRVQVKGTDDGKHSFQYGSLPVARVYRPRWSMAATLLPSVETILGLWIMSGASAKNGSLAEISAGQGA